jgi:hypothetical protein
MLTGIVIPVSIAAQMLDFRGLLSDQVGHDAAPHRGGAFRFKKVWPP